MIQQSCHHLLLPIVNEEKKIVCTFYLEGKCRFGSDCFNFHPDDVIVKQRKRQRNKKKKKKTTTSQLLEAEEEYKEKLPSMKTAGDVRKRIQWDSSFKREYFVVGYLDRFLGVVEKPFNAFTWEHLATVNNDQFAIPQHRIQYFKYRGMKVWDKNEKLDYIFGGYIQEVMKKVDDRELEEEKKNDDNNNNNHHSNSEDEENIIIGKSSSPIIFIKEEMVQIQKQKASHFFCIRLRDNIELKNIALKIQEKIIEWEPVLKDCVVPIELFHITLTMIHINNNNEKETVTKLAKILREDLHPKFQKLLLEEEKGGDEEKYCKKRIFAEGLSTFGAKVIYCKLRVPQVFFNIVETLRQSLKGIEGVVITNHFEFIPHITLMKMNRIVARKRRSEYFNSILYNDYTDKKFGFIPIDNINLCLVNDDRGNDGFYVTLEKIQF